MLLAHNVHRVAHEVVKLRASSADKRLRIICLTEVCMLVPGMQFDQCACRTGPRPGCHLTNLLGNQVVSISSVPAIDAPAAQKKQSWLLLLTVLFLISYGLMTMLIVEQGKTIESQRSLIRQLFRDSQELSAVRKAQQESAQPEVSTQTPATDNRSQNRSSQAPSTQYPSTQAPTRHAPSAQAGAQSAPQRGSQKEASKQKPQVRMPSKQASDLVDDVRSLIAI
jgi:hypothetical protein